MLSLFFDGAMVVEFPGNSLLPACKVASETFVAATNVEVLSVAKFVIGVSDIPLGVDCEVVGASSSVDGVASLLFRGSFDFT